MRAPVVWFGAVACVLTGGGDARPGRLAWDDEPPALFVTAPAGAESIQTSPGVVLGAPDIEFRALVERDPLHATPILAPSHGALRSLASERHARIGDTVAMIGVDTVAMGVVVRATLDGEWRPRRLEQQFVLSGDTIGMIVQHGYWLAIGAVSDLEYG